MSIISLFQSFMITALSTRGDAPHFVRRLPLAFILRAFGAHFRLLGQSEETLHTTTSTNDNVNHEAKHTISEAHRRRAESLLRDRSIDADTRTIIRYGLELGDSWVSELVRRADAGDR